MSPKSSILLPLYIYPLPGAWEPLHEAIRTYPALHFTIIINPNSGPGGTPHPDACYAPEIRRLTVHLNVTIVGYIRIDYCKKPLAAVYEEIATYAGWGRSEQGLGVQGIFFDETPNLYQPDVKAYLDAVSGRVKGVPGLGKRMVIHNPGTPPDAGLASPGPDITTVVEESYAQYRSATLQERLASILPYERARCSYMVHSVPRGQIGRLVAELRHRGEYLFVTELCEDYYVRFGASWEEFCGAMDVDAPEG